MLTLQDMSIGRARKDAYQSLSGRTSSPDQRRFHRSVIQADTYGIAIADVLRVQAAEMRLRRRQRAEEQAMKIPVKVLFPLTFCILRVLFIVLLTPAVLSMVAAFSGAHPLRSKISASWCGLRLCRESSRSLRACGHACPRGATRRHESVGLSPVRGLYVHFPPRRGYFMLMLSR